MTTTHKRRYLVYQGKKYRIRSSASDKDIYKALIKIIEHLVRRKSYKNSRKSKNKKGEFIPPVHSASGISQEQLEKYK